MMQSSIRVSITQSDIDRLKSFVDRTQRGEMLSAEEVQEFYDLAKKIESEPRYKSDVGTLFLVGLAGFLVGLAIGNLSPSSRN